MRREWYIFVAVTFGGVVWNVYYLQHSPLWAGLVSGAFWIVSLTAGWETVAFLRGKLRQPILRTIGSVCSIALIAALSIWLFAERCKWPEVEGNPLTDCHYGITIEIQRLLKFVF